MLAASLVGVAAANSDAGAQEGRPTHATLTSEDIAPLVDSTTPELTEAEAEQMLFSAIVNDARALFWGNEYKRGVANAARLAVAQLKRDRAVRSAVYNPKRRSLTVVLRSGYSREVTLVNPDWGSYTQYQRGTP